MTTKEMPVMAAKKIDRSVRIVRALAEVCTSVHVESWEHDTPELAALAVAVNEAKKAAHAYVAAKVEARNNQ